jgi:hypothetical protein
MLMLSLSGSLQTTTGNYLYVRLRSIYGVSKQALQTRVSCVDYLPGSLIYIKLDQVVHPMTQIPQREAQRREQSLNSCSVRALQRLFPVCW